jgi:hypothetical protein
VLAQVVQRFLDGGSVIRLAVALRSVIALQVGPTRERADEFLVSVRACPRWAA